MQAWLVKQSSLGWSAFASALLLTKHTVVISVSVSGTEEEETTWAADPFWIHSALGRRGHKNDGKHHLHVPGYGAEWGERGECSFQVKTLWPNALCLGDQLCKVTTTLTPGQQSAHKWCRYIILPGQTLHNWNCARLLESGIKTWLLSFSPSVTLFQQKKSLSVIQYTNSPPFPLWLTLRNESDFQVCISIIVLPRPVRSMVSVMMFHSRADCV